MLSRSRPDIFDNLVSLWLSTAVGLAAIATAPLEAFRAPYPEPESWAPGAAMPELEGGEPPPEASTVSPVRPDDVSTAPEIGRATSETCGNCRHFHRANSRAGECRRYSPGLPEEGMRAEWPVALDGEWCGQFFKAHVPSLTREDLDGLH